MGPPQQNPPFRNPPHSGHSRLLTSPQRLPQRRVHPTLPARPAFPPAFDHIGINPQCDRFLGIGLGPADRAAALAFAECSQHLGRQRFGGRLRAGEIFLGSFRIVVKIGGWFGLIYSGASPFQGRGDS